MVASAVMGGVTWGAYEALLEVMPGTALSTQIIRLSVTIGVSLMALTAAAQLLRIREFAEARDLVLGRFKRIAG